MSNLVIKIASMEELSKVAELFDLYRQFYEQESNLALANKFIHSRMANQQSVIITATETDGEMVGFCQLYPTFCSVIAAPVYALYDLFVIPSKRRTGAGKMLLIAAEDQARLAGVRRMDLTTAKSNFPAQALYESLGWEKDTVFVAYNKHLTCKLER